MKKHEFILLSIFLAIVTALLIGATVQQISSVSIAAGTNGIVTVTNSGVVSVSHSGTFTSSVSATNFTVLGSTNAIIFANTNSAAPQTNAAKFWVSVQVAGLTNEFRIQLVSP